ncbi:signal peptidase II [Pontibacillus marinus]|uniref:Lipoprotein signal peptidase n=1 Tax=Pontibacillus marinus BH030004 = DSM 16465 TaxID=1385511 RepID=A0A0A5HPZ9_9BACI|nr:signal peptidase II [Pontibacillus marinus]KGX85702.1 peptidase A8 [Pontibacillus marinus BH030004 = DSM 16465]
MWYYFIAAAVLILDQLTKWMIVKRMEIGEHIPVIENFFYITSHRNRGAAWGILQGQMWFFYIVTAIVICVVIYYMHKYASSSKVLGLSLGLILGGAIGNFIDRLFRKEVVDFIDIYIGSYDYPIFNIADSALVVGVILVFFATMLDERKKGSKSS